MKTQIINSHQYNNLLAAGGQPTVDQIAELKESGFSVLINISPQSAKNALTNEALLAEKQELIYVHFPVDCSNLQTYHFETFRAILNQFKDKKTFVHCGANIKTSNLLHLYNVLEMKFDEKVSLKELYSIQKPEEKWFVYFSSFGLTQR